MRSRPAADPLPPALADDQLGEGRKPLVSSGSLCGTKTVAILSSVNFHDSPSTRGATIPDRPNRAVATNHVQEGVVETQENNREKWGKLGEIREEKQS